MEQLPSSQVSLVYLSAWGCGTVANHQAPLSQMQRHLVKNVWHIYLGKTRKCDDTLSSGNC